MLLKLTLVKKKREIVFIVSPIERIRAKILSSYIGYLYNFHKRPLAQLLEHLTTGYHKTM